MIELLQCSRKCGSGSSPNPHTSHHIRPFTPPSIHAYSLEALRLRPGNKFLDIGCGCGILSIMASSLVGTAGLVHGIDMLAGV